MASPFLWPVLVPSALRAPAPVNLGVRPQETYRMDSKDFLAKYAWAIQIIGVIVFGWVATWIAKRSNPPIKEGWMYSGYTLTIKMLYAAFVAFMLAALWHNGMALFKEDWWVPPAIIGITASAFWLAYDVFLTTLRWNEEALELYRVFLPPKAINIREVASIKHNPASESILITDVRGMAIRFNAKYRVGIANLLSHIQHVHAST